THEEDDETDLLDTRKKKEYAGWKLYTDKASSKVGSGAGLMIVSPKEVGPRVIMSEYQDVRRCKKVKRLRESLTEAPLEVSECVNTEEKVIINQRYPEQAIVIGRQLTTHFKKELLKLLKDNADIFAWEYSDMKGILITLKIRNEAFVTEHKLQENKKITLV
nr:reverse transcriptase domain-containing protein [Tanacetum cinerariifolium]